MTTKTKRVAGWVGLTFVFVVPLLLNEYERSIYSKRLTVFSLLFLIVSLANWTMTEDEEVRDDEG